MDFEGLTGNTKAKAMEKIIQQIRENDKSTVILELYGAEDYWWEEHPNTLTCKHVEDACATWTRTIHPHEGGYSHSITLIRGLNGDTFQLYTIKSIEIIKER